MTTCILTAIDMTAEASWKIALPKAVDLARQNEAALHILYVVPDPGAAMLAEYFPADFAQKSIAKAASDLKSLVAAEVPADLGAKVHLRNGRVHEEILAAITETGADLVVMASHAPDRVREFLVGSEADRVVRRSPVSVFVVRE
jgi:nucleotide-binding universal stress UspA family protein